MDVKISELSAISAAQMDGTEYFFIQKGNENFKVSSDELALYSVQSVVLEGEVTLDGNANNGLEDNYVDLYTPKAGNKIEHMSILSNGLVPLADNVYIQVLLTDGNPVNDVALTDPISTNELEGENTLVAVNGTEVQTGFDIKLLVTGGTITAGTVEVNTYFR